MCGGAQLWAVHGGRDRRAHGRSDQDRGLGEDGAGPGGHGSVRALCSVTRQRRTRAQTMLSHTGSNKGGEES